MRPGENYRDVALQKQRLLSLNQQVLDKKMSLLERSFSTRMTKVEKIIEKVVSTLGKVPRKVRGRSSSCSSSSPSPSPPPPVFHSGPSLSAGPSQEPPQHSRHGKTPICLDTEEIEGFSFHLEHPPAPQDLQDYSYYTLFQGLSIQEDEEYGDQSQWQ